jgi:hypothetical protein
MATYPVVTSLPVFEDRIKSAWPQEYRTVRGRDMLVHIVIFNGVQYMIEAFDQGDYVLNTYVA